MISEDQFSRLVSSLDRIANALERLSPPPAAYDFSGATAYVWSAHGASLTPIEAVNAPPFDLILACDDQKHRLLENTQRFARGAAANNALLWGARGVGKSALVKSTFVEVSPVAPDLKLIEIHRDEIASLPDLMRILGGTPERFIIYCDDLSFEAADASYKALKAALEGGVEGRPANTLFYATSNRKHLTPREMREQEDIVAVRRGEAGEETLSLADRFGLSLGFYALSQDDYLAIIAAYKAYFSLKGDAEALKKQALTWAAIRGGRSGRVAWQFIQDRLGADGRPGF